ncbi:MAG: ATP-binding protein, partial [Nakamurella sp.]
FTETDLPERLSPVISRTAFRVVQEALTNAAKHAAGSPVDVRVTGAESGINISVINTADATVVDELVRQAGGGRGLAGIEERAQLVGGTLTSAPRPAGGFEVSAWLPTRLRPVGARPEQPTADGQ